MFQNIPEELKRLNQWVVWCYVDKGGPKPTKVPFCPRWATHAAVDNPNTWGSFTDALQAMQSGKPDGIGFVLTEEDPYGFIDLDNAWQKNEHGAFVHADPQATHDMQVRIFNDFDSYSEKSPSGEGLHIIVKADGVPNGRKRSSIELYTSKRFMTMTGEVFNSKNIEARSELFHVLWGEMGRAASNLPIIADVDQRQSDEEVFNQAAVASNGEKFVKLWNCEWQSYYPSQSEADFALVDILAFYTQNREQIRRMFYSCALGARNKQTTIGGRSYIEHMTNRAFDRMLPPIDMSGLMLLMNEARERAANGAAEGPTAPALPSAPQGSNGSFEPGKADASSHATQAMPVVPLSVNNQIPVPPGLIGDVAQYFYEQAPRPVMQIALAGALGFVAGIVGRAYNVNGLALNHYIMLIAPTGTGKEAINSGVSKLAKAVAEGPGGAPDIRKFVGPGEFRSDAALYKSFLRSKSFVSILGEVGLLIKRMSGENANPHDKGVKRAWLDLYNKSGHGNILYPIVYSDKANNTEPIEAPAFTMVGESTPEQFFEALDETMIASGLLPRFTIIEYLGLRPKLNEASNHAKPSDKLIDQLRRLVVHINTIGDGVVDVPMSPEARSILGDFNEYADSQINHAGNELTRQIWNRAHVKAMKLAALVSVGIHSPSPVIDYHCAKWAIDLVASDITSVLGRFERGEVGANQQSFNGDENKQMRETIKWLKKLFSGSADDALQKYRLPSVMFNSFCIPKHIIIGAMQNYACFRTVKGSARGAVKNTLEFMKESGMLAELPPKQIEDAFGHRQATVQLADPTSFFGR